jgi:excinuclease ABC subunit A
MPDTEQLFSARFACPVCGHSVAELEPRLFSFNNPAGACTSCDGLGMVTFFDPARIVAHPHLSLASGAIRGWDRRNQFYFQLLSSLATFYKFDIDTPFDELDAKLQSVVLDGSGKERIPFRYLSESGRSTIREHTFEGVVPNLERRYRETDSVVVREELGKYRNTKVCPDCQGTRLRSDARHVKVAGHTLPQLAGLPLRACKAIFDGMELDGARAAIAARIMREVAARLGFLIDVGLDYLSLDRSAESLSGGEAQRIRLASQIGSGLTGVMYVLDEPSIGLHQRDNARLLGTLSRLRDLGNTVVVVEHDQEAIEMADHVVDMGPGAGEHGGEVIAQGTPADIAACEASLTGAYLSGRKRIAVPAENPHAAEGRLAAHPRRTRQQPAGHRRRHSGRPADLRHRRVRIRQVDADQRHAVRRRRASPVRLGRAAGRA